MTMVKNVILLSHSPDESNWPLYGANRTAVHPRLANNSWSPFLAFKVIPPPPCDSPVGGLFVIIYVLILHDYPTIALAVRESTCEETVVTADPDLLHDGPADASTTIILAHGAGAAMDTPFMNFFATGLAERWHRVVRFEFPYMASKRSAGKSKPPDREPVLRSTWLKVIKKAGQRRRRRRPNW
jgi:hypothetical protein